MVRPVIHRIAHRAAAVALAVGIAGAGFAASVPAAWAGSGHACQAVKTTADTTREGVFCADISNSTNGPTVIVNIGTEGVCQTQVGATPEQCSNVSITGGLWSPDGELVAFSFNCGHANPPCATPRAVFNVPINVTLKACEQVWTVVDAGSTIILPGSGKPVTLPANLGSGHITICP
ncbi:MAG TPA: hypothetical protein VN767_17590 [Streptosporangiaceae bacterium]|nr:hypothetical protein [Streptosporangiaceae bacterium]